MMTKGKVEVFFSHKEPEFKDNILWLRPYLDKEGYELLYYGASGWTSLIDYTKVNTPSIEPIPDEDCVEEVQPEHTIPCLPCSKK